jgi:flagellar biosynthesis/type III secretory pathway protein FliH
MLGEDSSQDTDEQEFIMAMYKTWEETRAEARSEGHAEGRAEGRAEARANDVLTVLRVRGIAVPEAVRQQILAQKDLQRLEQWLEKAAVATAIGDVIDSPN